MAGTGEFLRAAPYGPRPERNGHASGVFVEFDQAMMPAPPSDWIGVKLYDHAGNAIGLAYVPAEHNDRLLLASAWGYFDARISASADADHRPPLRLVEP